MKSALVEWSKQEYGNIFVCIATLEDIIKVKEAQLEILTTLENRADLSRSKVEFTRFMMLEEDFW